MTGLIDLAVIIAAYRAERWIGDCLASVRASIAALPRSCERIEVRVGVDGCPATALKCYGVTDAWYATRNVGVALMRNSLVAIAPARLYAIFDADDVMRVDYLPQVWAASQTAPIVGTGRVECDAHLQPLYDSAFDTGVCAIRSDAWHLLGGYRPYRYGADVDLHLRARALGLQTQAIPDPLFLRRQHPGSLTRDPATDSLSCVRQLAYAEMQALRAVSLHVDPIRVPLRRQLSDPYDDEVPA